jgi:hypothetical protein
MRLFFNALDSERFIMSVIVAVLVACAVVRCEPAIANAGRPAWLSLERIPTPTFKDVHEQYFRIAWNEAGPKNLADQDGILQSLLFAGGGRKEGRTARGQGYGLDYKKLMLRMIAHSTRTFPADSRFLLFTDAQRTRLVARQTRRNRWTSTLKLDCSEPAGWPERKLDGKPMGSFRLHYGERCQRLVETTREFLKGHIASQCDGQPTTWGAGPDITRRGGPIEEGWTEVFCHHAPSAECAELDRRERLNSSVCAQNRFWDWR